MFKNFFFTIFLSLIFVSFLEASNEKINQQLFELKTSQEYAQKINDEKITLIMGQIIQKENEIKELEKKIDELRKDKNSLSNYKDIIDRQDKRIEDIHSNVNFWGVIFTLIGTLTAVIIILYTLKFGAMAVNGAEKEVKNWIDEKADEEFKPKVTEYLDKIEVQLKRYKELTDKYNIEYEKAKEYNKQFEKSQKRLQEEKLEFNNNIKFVENPKIEDLFDLMRINNYKKVLKEIEKIKSNKFNGYDEFTKFDILWLEVHAVDLGKIENDEVIIDMYINLIKNYSTNKNIKIQEKLSKVYINLASKYDYIGNYQKSKEEYLNLINTFKDVDNSEINLSVISAYVNLGSLLERDNDYSSAIKYFDKAISESSQFDNEKISYATIIAYRNKIIVYQKLNNYYEALRLCNIIISKYKRDEKLLGVVYDTYLDKQVINLRLGKLKEVIAIHSEMEDNGDEYLLEKYLKSYINCAIAYHRLNNNKKSLEIYDEIINKYSNSPLLIIREVLIAAYINKIELVLILNGKNRDDDLYSYYKLVKDKKSELLKYQMLILLEKAKDSEIDEEIISWKDEFKDTLLEDGWSFYELKTWANSFEDEVVKERLLRYIDIFEKHNESVEEN